MGLDPVTGLIFGKPMLKHASEMINLSIKCLDQYGGRYTYRRTLLVNAVPRVNTFTKYYTVNATVGLNFLFNTSKILYDPDGDLLDIQMTKATDLVKLKRQNLDFDILSKCVYGKPRTETQLFWFTFRATDPHGSWGELELKIVIEDYKPYVDWAKVPPDQYFTVNSDFIF